jgi:DNA replication and repair protein RecF
VSEQKTLRIDDLQARGFRNLRSDTIALGPRFTVLSGDNGQGKTNVLEALYVALTSKSFRTSKLGELLAHDGQNEGVATVRVHVVEDGSPRTQTVALRKGQRLVKIDEKRPASLAEYAVQSPVVVFHPGELSLSMGASSERRRLLDRVALYSAPVALDSLERYTHAMRARQKVLATRGVGASDLDDWEALMAEHGAQTSMHRRRAAEQLGARATAVFESIGSPGLSLSVSYAPGGPESREDLVKTLAEYRAADMRRGSANRGPHRDDLSLELSSHAARGTASQGQHRAIVLSLKAAEITEIGNARGVRPVLLLDDVSSELDRERTRALFSFLRAQQGQVLLTTTRPELIDIAQSEERVDYTVCDGVVKALTAG